MVFVTFSYNTLNATCNMQQSQECPPVTAMSWGKTLNVKSSLPRWGFSPGKPDLCSDQTPHFGRSKPLR